MKLLPRSFFLRRADQVARDLIGATVRSRIGGRLVSGIIVETEAYLGFDDPASHGYRGRLHAGNVNLYAPPGSWYVYRSYGIHWCANLVCGGPSGSAVLLRAIQPVRGVDLMRRRRGGVGGPRIADGPGKLCQALGITRELDGLPMFRSPVRVLGPGTTIPTRIETTARIGITKAADWPLRFLRPPLRPPDPPAVPPVRSAARGRSARRGAAV